MEHGQQGAESVGAMLSSIAAALREFGEKLDEVALRVDGDRGVETRLARLEAWAFRAGQDISDTEPDRAAHREHRPAHRDRIPAPEAPARLAREPGVRHPLPDAFHPTDSEPTAQRPIPDLNSIRDPHISGPATFSAPESFTASETFTAPESSAPHAAGVAITPDLGASRSGTGAVAKGPEPAESAVGPANSHESPMNKVNETASRGTRREPGFAAIRTATAGISAGRDATEATGRRSVTAQFAHSAATDPETDNPGSTMRDTAAIATRRGAADLREIRPDQGSTTAQFGHPAGAIGTAAGLDVDEGNPPQRDSVGGSGEREATGGREPTAGFVDANIQFVHPEARDPRTATNGRHSPERENTAAHFDQPRAIAGHAAASDSTATSPGRRSSRQDGTGLAEYPATAAHFSAESAASRHGSSEHSAENGSVTRRGVTSERPAAGFASRHSTHEPTADGSDTIGRPAMEREISAESNYSARHFAEHGATLDPIGPTEPSATTERDSGLVAEQALDIAGRGSTPGSTSHSAEFGAAVDQFARLDPVDGAPIGADSASNLARNNSGGQGSPSDIVEHRTHTERLVRADLSSNAATGPETPARALQSSGNTPRRHLENSAGAGHALSTGPDATAAPDEVNPRFAERLSPAKQFATWEESGRLSDYDASAGRTPSAGRNGADSHPGREVSGGRTLESHPVFGQAVGSSGNGSGSDLPAGHPTEFASGLHDIAREPGTDSGYAQSLVSQASNGQIGSHATAADPAEMPNAADRPAKHDSSVSDPIDRHPGADPRLAAVLNNGSIPRDVRDLIAGISATQSGNRNGLSGNPDDRHSTAGQAPNPGPRLSGPKIRDSSGFHDQPTPPRHSEPDYENGATPRSLGLTGQSGRTGDPARAQHTSYEDFRTGEPDQPLPAPNGNALTGSRHAGEHDSQVDKLQAMLDELKRAADIPLGSADIFGPATDPGIARRPPEPRRLSGPPPRLDPPNA
ncbi:hypothetical protein D5S18_21965 [Nocardia panacis]|uniref:Uncharacterized protein n=1 Tax=Nocardia panacis TaxID=2340916 RepID=A0A3A4KHD4_9NOCA|nr:hypothetical protein [Nocardia panacis]RJO72952.1 hypothetical protein D5S18_21965 [Nocardia panacis]